MNPIYTFLIYSSLTAIITSMGFAVYEVLQETDITKRAPKPAKPSKRVQLPKNAVGLVFAQSVVNYSNTKEN